jgi:hypothetical protein
VEKRLVLKEELQITRRLTTESVEIPVSVKKQKAVISREAGDGAQAAWDSRMPRSG